MDNLSIYNKVRKVPQEAQKKIIGGRLSGKTDINPMWRIKALTEQFGPCGIGWKYEITEKRLEAGAKDEIAAFVDINLYVKIEGGWSAAIPGTGGSSFVANEKNGPYTSDECFKMALTDAISVSCKALGVGADVYWSEDATTYDGAPPPPDTGGKTVQKPGKKQLIDLLATAQEKNISLKIKGKEWTGKNSSTDWDMEDYKKVKENLEKMGEAK